MRGAYESAARETEWPGLDSTLSPVVADPHPNVRTFVRLLGFLRPYRWSLAASVVLAVGSQLAAVAIAFLTGDALQRTVDSENTDQLWALALAVLLVGAARALFMVGRRLISGRQALAVEFDMRNELYAKLLRLSFGFYDRHQTGQLMSRATVDLQAVRFFLGYGLIFFFQHVLTIVGVTIVLFVIEWQLALVAPRDHAAARRDRVPLPPGLASGAARRAAADGRRRDGRRGEHRRRPRRQVVRAGAERGGEVRARVRGGLRRRACGRTGSGRSTCRCCRSCRSSRRRASCSSAGAWSRAASSHSTTSSRSTCSCSMLVMPLRMLGMWIGQAQRATASGERIFEVIDEPEEIARRARCAPSFPRATGRVALRAVHRSSYATGPPGARRRSTSSSRPGRTVALIGHTGSGKTTLASLVPRFYDVTAGPRHDRRRRRARRDASTSLRRAIGVVAQDPFLFSATVRENIAFGAARRDRRGRSSAPHALAQAHDFIARAARRLRHGDRRARDHALGRPAPADRDRARAHRRPAHPDPRRRDRVGRRDDRGAHPPRPPRGDEAGRTTIIIAHRLSTIALADELVVLDRRPHRRRAARTRSCSRASPVYREIYEHGLLEREFAERVEARAEADLDRSGDEVAA